MNIKPDNAFLTSTEADPQNNQETSCDISRTISVPQVVTSKKSSTRKKRKRSSDNAPVPDLRFSEEQCIYEDISENGISDYNCNFPTIYAKGQCQETSTLVKRARTVHKKELNSLRVQIAMISDVDGDRPIHVAVAQEDIKLVQKLCTLMLKAAISLDLTNFLRQTPLHLAVMLGNTELVTLLLKHGACITLRDRNGNSVLHLAVKSDVRKDVLCLILSHPETNSILNTLDYEGYSALHYAVVRNNKTAIRCFHAAGAEMDVTDGKSGRSPLIHSILDQNVEMVRLLLECGASAEVVDYSGRSAFEFALHSSHKNIAKLLEKKLFDVNADHHVPVVDPKSRDNSVSISSTRTRSERIAKRSKKSSNRNKWADFETS